jgi:hypothetical protein
MFFFFALSIHSKPFIPFKIPKIISRHLHQQSTQVRMKNFFDATPSSIVNYKFVGLDLKFK